MRIGCALLQALPRVRSLAFCFLPCQPDFWGCTAVVAGLRSRIPNTLSHAVRFAFEPPLHSCSQKETARRGRGLGRRRRRARISRGGGARNEAVAAANTEDDGGAAGEGGASVGGYGRTGRLADEHVCRAPGKRQTVKSLPFARCCSSSLFLLCMA